ncbi:hypothetical protein [Mesorhizobium sp. M1B.F.Ca.ET.045.04.1.1]|uniref:hypothetical protein n=1 Tax=Mesorhizobium sp. M1B.F.Ca.ET.045.04.1.1 TaxID=2493673 RepID=UPI000F759CBA|nr:hypothetical protein [Mesorhizobium sp. M1B.F.Ca.ET.045.04.1.1]AZO32336.1 hypothetical protein EJ071_36655 [Mesorhizobium sp. M1B.F.Ca.ET.045.04.1.1]
MLQLGGSSTAAGYIYLDLNASDPNTGVSDAGSGALTISSGATFDDQSDGGLYIYANNWGPGDDGSAAAVNNAGTFVKSGLATTSTIATRFNNTGTVEVESGTLSLSAGGIDVGATYQGAGTVNFSGGTRMLDAASIITANATFSGGATTVNGSYNVSGTTTVSGGSAILAGSLAALGSSLNISAGSLQISGSNASVDAFTQSGGLLEGSGTLTVSGAATLSGGSEGGSGTTLAQGGAAFNGSFGLDGGRVLQLGGSSTATGYIYLDLNAAIRTQAPAILALEPCNRSGTIFDDQSDGGLYIYANNWGLATTARPPRSTTPAPSSSRVGNHPTIATRFNNTGW